MSVLGFFSGYTVKYNPLPSGVPSGFALRISFRQRIHKNQKKYLKKKTKKIFQNGKTPKRLEICQN